MHDCQRFREDWVAGLAKDFGACEQCRSFSEDVQLILKATEAEAIEMPSEAYWLRYDAQLRGRLEKTSRARLYWKWSAATAAAAAAFAVVLIWDGGMRPSPPAFNNATSTPQIEFVDDHINGLNPTVVTYLAQSELFLRNFTKIDPAYTEDLQDAQARAQQVLAEIEIQKMRAADFAPVRIALDEYENVLRDIKNLESAEGVADIQGVIQSSGLIASMRAYQPQIILVRQQ